MRIIGRGNHAEVMYVIVSHPIEAERRCDSFVAWTPQVFPVIELRVLCDHHELSSASQQALRMPPNSPVEDRVANSENDIGKLPVIRKNDPDHLQEVSQALYYGS